ncbi:MAG: hypothetical protein JXX28_04160 [Deltaproteobacteria bacterium]|nr:hypothetical protein [Deltaproteobacteria bacterium]
MRHAPLALILLAACPKADTGDTAPDEAIVSFAVHPALLGQGVRVEADLTAAAPTFAFGQTYATLGEGVFVESITVRDSYAATLDLVVDADAPLGPRDLRLEVDGRVWTLPEVVQVVEQSLTATPASGKMGALVEVELAGAATAWETGYTWASFGAGIDVLELEIDAPDHATALLAVHPDARPGYRDVSVESGPSVVTLTDGFLVDRQVITAVFDPPEAEQGDTVDFVLDGVDTSWDSGTALQFWDEGGPNPDIAITQLTVVDGEHAFGRLRLSNAARLGERDVLVRAGTGEALLIPDAMEVLEGPIDLSHVAVNIGLDVFRERDNATGELYERVQAYAMFYVPLDPPCGPPQAMTDSPKPYDLNGVFPDPPEPEPVDCPYPRTLPAGDVVWFESDENIITMAKSTRPSTGQILYIGQNLLLSDYRFGQTYDLHTQGDPAAIPEVLLEGVQPTVPADWHIQTPELWGDRRVPRAEPFSYSWSPARTYPDAFFVTKIHGTLDATGDSGYAGAIPWDDGQHTYAPGELLSLRPGSVSFVAFSYIKGPYFGLPFSIYQENQSSSALQLTASMVLE